ncbi:hypothetical protein C6495_12610, partial [Candidatus Poribacteria bacterium]
MQVFLREKKSLKQQNNVRLKGCPSNQTRKPFIYGFLNVLVIVLRLDEAGDEGREACNDEER